MLEQRISQKKSQLTRCEAGSIDLEAEAARANTNIKVGSTRPSVILIWGGKV